jgi:hypothetical protein
MAASIAEELFDLRIFQDYQARPFPHASEDGLPKQGID